MFERDLQQTCVISLGAFGYTPRGPMYIVLTCHVMTFRGAVRCQRLGSLKALACTQAYLCLSSS